MKFRSCGLSSRSLSDCSQSTGSKILDLTRKNLTIRGPCVLGSADVAPEIVHEAVTLGSETHRHASGQIFGRGRLDLTSGLCQPVRRTSGKLPMILPQSALWEKAWDFAQREGMVVHIPVRTLWAGHPRSYIFLNTAPRSRVLTRSTFSQRVSA